MMLYTKSVHACSSHFNLNQLVLSAVTRYNCFAVREPATCLKIVRLGAVCVLHISAFVEEELVSEEGYQAVRAVVVFS